MDEEKKSNFKITDGFILGAIPVIGYFVAFVYESSYARVYGYPISFISLGLESILIATLTIFGFFAGIYIVIDFGIALIKTKTLQSKLGKFVIVGFIIYFIWALILYLGDSGWYGWFLFSSLFITGYILELVFPFFQKRRIKLLLKDFLIRGTNILITTDLR